MNTITFKIMLLSSNATGQYPVYMRVTFKRRSITYATTYVASKEDIINKKKPTLRTGTAITRLSEDYVNSFRKTAQTIDPDLYQDMKVSEVYKLVKEKRKQFLEKATGFQLDFPEYGRQIAQTKKTATRKNYNNAIKSFCKYMGREHFDISEILSTTLRGYEQWLKETLGKYTKTISMYIGALAVIHKNARQEFNVEELNIIKIKNPFQYFTPEQKPVSKTVKPANREMIQYMIDHLTEFNNDERRAAELFLLIFALQGMNVADMMKAKKPEKDVITFERSKTMEKRPDRAETKVLIHDCIKPLYEKYKDPEDKLAFNFARRYNLEYFHIQSSKWMKALRARLKIEEQFRSTADELRYGSARHSYATISNSLGISKGIINDGMSHVDRTMAITDIYIEKDWRLIWDANKKLLDSFNWTPLGYSR